MGAHLYGKASTQGKAAHKAKQLLLRRQQGCISVPGNVSSRAGR